MELYYIKLFEGVFMKVLKVLLLAVSCIILIGCSSGGSSPVHSDQNLTLAIQSFADQMDTVMPREDLPNASLRFASSWPDNNGTYTFNIFSRETKDPSMSVYYGAKILDDVAEGVSDLIPLADLTRGTHGSAVLVQESDTGEINVPVRWAPASQTVNLPTGFPFNMPTSINDFQIRIEVDHPERESIAYYMREGNTDKLYIFTPKTDEGSFTYAERDLRENGEKKFWCVNFYQPESGDGYIGTITYVEFDGTSFRVAFARENEKYFGGGTAIITAGELDEEKSKVAIRHKRTGPTVEVYDIFTYAEAIDPGFSPDNKSPDDLGDEDDLNKKFIVFGDGSLFNTEAELNSFQSPTNVDQLYPSN